MTADSRLLDQLVAVSKLDAQLAGIIAERKRIDSQLKEKTIALKKSEEGLVLATRLCDDRKAKYNKSEKSLRDEQQRLVERRKALTTLQNYKLQQAAGREIDSAAQALSAQEEGMLGLLAEVEKLTGEVERRSEERKTRAAEFQSFEQDAVATLSTLEERERGYREEREKAVVGIDPGSLATYSRIRDRYPMDPVMKANGNTCAGCFMQLGPQVNVQIARGGTLVRCPGCGRILYHESDSK